MNSVHAWLKDSMLVKVIPLPIIYIYTYFLNKTHSSIVYIKSSTGIYVLHMR